MQVILVQKLLYSGISILKKKKKNFQQNVQSLLYHSTSSRLYFISIANKRGKQTFISFTKDVQSCEWADLELPKHIKGNENG